MSWARYDDAFDDHPKVAAVLNDDPAALALHLVANTWTHRNHRGGYVPRATAERLVGRENAAAWTTVLVRHGLAEVAEDGWRFHDWADYAPDGEQQRRAANARWRNASASERSPNASERSLSAVRARSRRNASASERSPNAIQNDASRAPEPVPVPVPVNASTDVDANNSARVRVREAEPPEVDLDDLSQDTRNFVQVYVDSCRAAGAHENRRILARVGQEANRLLAEGHDGDNIAIALRELARRNEQPARLAYIVGDVERVRAGTPMGRVIPAPIRQPPANEHDEYIRAIREGRA